MPLPIDSILPEICALLRLHNNIVLSAEPGAGKTTGVPPALLTEEWLARKKIIMLEPRRIAAVRSAEYMSRHLNERTGETIGFRIRGETKTSARTRIEIVTEGVLTRILQDDPSLAEYGLVIFDEFHERSIHADLGLAMTIDVQAQIRNDLKILVMSATMNSAAVAHLLPSAVEVKSEGRSYPVTTHYRPNPSDDRMEPVTANAVSSALRNEEGDILVFLPGQREIRTVETLLREKELPGNVIIHALFGDAPPEKQQAALSTAPPGMRKVVLSTNIAETSITIDGIRIVIDSGLSRIAKFDPRRGMTGLVTVPVSHASADQRKGRAGRQGPGVCYRLWTELQHTQLPEFSLPEILLADLASFALDLALWGDSSGKQLKFIDSPPNANLTRAQHLLRFLGAVDDNGRITDHGRAMAGLPVHPRLAHMVLKGIEIGLGPAACEIVALLDERDVLRGKSFIDVDLQTRYRAVMEGRTMDPGARKRIVELSRRLQRLLSLPTRPFGDPADVDRIGILLALVYPDRVAKRKSGDRYQLSGNTVGILPKESALFKEEYLAVGEVDGAGNDVKIFQAEPLSVVDIRTHFADQILERIETYWDRSEGCVIGRKLAVFGAVELTTTPFEPEPEEAKRIMIDVIRQEGLSCLPWDDGTISMRARSEWLRTRSYAAASWIDVSDETLLQSLEEWLGPYLNGIFRRSQIKKLDMHAIFRGVVPYNQVSEIDRLAPTHLTVPTGSRIPVDYSQEQPVLAVRLQEMFGETSTPAVGGGKEKVVLHLLSPARRPLAITQDLPSFWKNAYPDVRKDMRGQYPKHYWPENPLEAEPTRKTKKYIRKL